MPIAFRDQVSRSNVTGATLAQTTMPAHEPGDLLMWLVGTNVSGGTPSFSTPAGGWASLGAALNGNNSQYMSFIWKIAQSNNETAPTTTVGGSSPVSACTMLSYSGAAAAFDTGTVFNAANQFGVTSYALPSITTTKPNCIVVRAFMFVRYSTGTPTVSWASSTERVESSNPSPFGEPGAFVVADKFQAVAGVAGAETVTFTGGGSSYLTGVVFSWPSAPTKPNQFFAMF